MPEPQLPSEPDAAHDLLQHPDPCVAAESAAVENLLRCWIREAGIPVPTHGTLRIPLPASGTALLAPVHYRSATGWHRFGLPHLAGAPHPSAPADAVTVAALLAREASGKARTTTAAPTATAPPAAAPPATAPSAAAPTAAAPPAAAPPAAVPRARTAEPNDPHTGTATSPGPALVAHDPLLVAPHPDPTAHGPDLVARVADSVRRIATFLRDRRDTPGHATDLFLTAEQSLLFGHPLHPTPKSREGITAVESRHYSPELRGSFPLHWLAVAPSLLATDSAWTERGRLVPAPHLIHRLAGPALPLPEGHAALPLHPWQLREIRHNPEVAALMDTGLLRDLGAHGLPWHPTSSVRTVYRSGAPAMLKLSLGLCITNSRRENLRKELHRGVEVHRLLRTGLIRQWRAAHPTFDIVRDPAWLAVDGPDGSPVAGLDVMIRHNPFTPSDDVACVASVVAPRAPMRPDRPASSRPTASRPAASRLHEVITGLTERTGRPRAAVAAEWFLRYLEHVVRPVLWLDGEAGIALEAHQQNTLLLLDSHGWPAGGRYRDNQGYYFRESRRAELDARLPGIGEHSDTFVSDEVTDERFAYYLAINNVFGLIGAFGSQRLADETLLLAAFRRFLSGAACGPRRLRSTLPARLLDSPVLRCKANLLTRLHGLDELVGPVDTQSVYVTIANPLHV
ncbi:IucA/IucC family protein [Streptomyces sp. NPDC052687]|uniref:IucA/IucC family protein n=1 Tax=Streptomyces sp. NPDC052687 TaxID=3154759 RepID=UPI003423C3D8